MGGVAKSLKKIKDLFWNSSQKYYFVMRHPHVKREVEYLLNKPGFLGEDYFIKKQRFLGRGIY